MRSRGNASPGSSASGLGHATSDALDHTLLGLRTRRGWVERPVRRQPMSDGSPYAAPRVETRKGQKWGIKTNSCRQARASAVRSVKMVYRGGCGSSLGC